MTATEARINTENEAERILKFYSIINGIKRTIGYVYIHKTFINQEAREKIVMAGRILGYSCKILDDNSIKFDWSV